MGETMRTATGKIDMHPVNFLIVDDDQVSVMAIKRVLRRLRILNPIHEASDGEEALALLRAQVLEWGKLPPFLVTLDLNMPRMDGLEFLEAVRHDPVLHRIVVFVLSSSDMPADVASAYDNNVAGYIVKDDLGSSFLQAFELLEAYSRIVELPRIP